jgi:hypothetical protein
LRAFIERTSRTRDAEACAEVVWKPAQISSSAIRVNRYSVLLTTTTHAYYVPVDSTAE